MNEIWKDIPNYEGFYKASNKGRIKSLKRVIEHSHSGYQTLKERILKQSINKHGYFEVSLHKNKIAKTNEVHRLVALTFYKKTNKYVNHIDSNRKNNELNNLELVTNRENICHGLKKRKCKSEYMGVCWNGKAKKWQSQIRYQGKRYFLGLYDTELEAFSAYITTMKYYNIENKYL